MSHVAGVGAFCNAGSRGLPAALKKGVLQCAASGVLLLSVSQAVAQVSGTYRFDIASQPLADGLRALAQQSGVQIAYQTSAASHFTAPAIQGTMTAAEALTRLLAGSGLRYALADANTVTIQQASSGSPGADAAAGRGAVTLDAISVTGVGQTAAGPVLGYRATRTATGTKTDTALRDLPMSVQVVSRDLIADRQATSLTEALQAVSGVQQNGTSGNRAETFKVRGFASPGYAVDGVMLNPTGDRPETFLDLANVERIEVLKGPASALYGRGQPGGLINIVTRQPTEQFEADASVQAGRFGFWRGEGSISGPLNEDGSLSARLTAAAQTEEGFRDERAHSERQFLSTVFRWQPSAATRWTLGVDYTRQEVPFDRGLPVTADNKVSLPRERYLGEKWSVVDARKTRLSLGGEHEVNDRLTIRGSLRYDDARVRDTGIDHRDLLDDGRTLRRRYTDRVEDSYNADAQLEGQLKFDTGRVAHTVLAGFQYTRSQMDFTSYRANIDSIDIYEPVYGADKPAPTLNSDYVNDVRMQSVYLQDQLEFSPRWKALAGLRYDRVRQDMAQQVGEGSPRIRDSALTKRLGIVYQPVSPVSLYASYSESFAPQDGVLRDGGALDPEEGWQVEGGVKLDLIPDRLSLTSAVFQITKRNVATSDPVDSDYVVLTGKQRVRGIEFDLTGDVAPGWRIIASAAYLDARITRDEDYEVGNRLGGVPKWSGSLWTTYTIQAGGLRGLKIGAGVQAVGARKGDLDNSYSVAGYYRWDASVAYPVGKHVELALVARNITDRAYIETPVSRTENHPGAPRSLYASVKYRF